MTPPATSPDAASPVAPGCAHHAERPAVAVCMGCGTRLCRVCATSWEGIHFCVACLGERRRAAPARAGALGALGLAAGAAALLAALHYLRLAFANLVAGLL